MGVHDEYGKQVFRAATKHLPIPDDSARNLTFGPVCSGYIDATVENIAVEIEARTPKQIRGALVDLIFHPRPRKLLLLIPVPALGNPQKAAKLCELIMKELRPEVPFLAVVLTGTGDNPQFAADIDIVGSALHDLRSAA